MDWNQRLKWFYSLKSYSQPRDETVVRFNRWNSIHLIDSKLFRSSFHLHQWDDSISEFYIDNGQSIRILFIIVRHYVIWSLHVINDHQKIDYKFVYIVCFVVLIYLNAFYFSWTHCQLFLRNKNQISSISNGTCRSLKKKKTITSYLQFYPISLHRGILFLDIGAPKENSEFYIGFYNFLETSMKITDDYRLSKYFAN